MPVAPGLQRPHLLPLVCLRIEPGHPAYTGGCARYVWLYGGRNFMIGASSVVCCWIQVAKSVGLTTIAVLSAMFPCQSPQSSPHWILYVPICVGVAVKTLSFKGTASAFTPSAYNQNDCVPRAKAP